MPPKAAKRGSVASVEKRRKSLHSVAGDYDGGDFDMEDAEMDLQPPQEVKYVPDNQVKDLTDADLNEVFTKVITASNPNAPKGLTKFDYETGEYALFGGGQDQLAVHFVMEGDLIEADGDEARDQERFKELIANRELMVKSSSSTQTQDGKEVVPDDYPAIALSGDITLKNQFNFSERATQTFNYPKRVKDISTEPPHTTEYKGTVNRWEIYDTYLSELERKVEAASLQEKSKPSLLGKKKNEEHDDVEVVNLEEETDDAESASPEGMDKALKVMERIVHTNSEAECFTDYKYFEDKSELKRDDGRGSFLPLWRFAYEGAHKKTVSAICWNPQFSDLFAVGYGSYDFVSQAGGMICCFSLKNTSYPEYIFETESGVMSLDFHPVHSSLLCVGMYDGTVAVYDVKQKGDGKPIYQVTDPKLKHMDPVWQVYWSQVEGVPDADGEIAPINFYSVSSDGRVSNWALSKTDLLNEEVVELKLQRGDLEEDVDESTVVGLAGGCCFDFDKDKEHLFVVGTEEGAIQAYDKAYNAQHLRSFDGHHMAVYSVKWNPFHPDVFLSCSADWTVKLWERHTTRPVMTFDLNTSVGDVAWAPFSSTVFATITTDGKVRVFDLNVNKHEPIGETRVNKKAKLTHISFNPSSPIICVGDDRGVVTILKLSSNLRKMSASKLTDVHAEEEISKLDNVMIMPDDDGVVDIGALLEKARAAPIEGEAVPAIEAKE